MFSTYTYRVVIVFSDRMIKLGSILGERATSINMLRSPIPIFQPLPHHDTYTFLQSVNLIEANITASI
jgi:hypothetical protein